MEVDSIGFLELLFLPIAASVTRWWRMTPFRIGFIGWQKCLHNVKLIFVYTISAFQSLAVSTAAVKLIRTAFHPCFLVWVEELHLCIVVFQLWCNLVSKNARKKNVYSRRFGQFDQIPIGSGNYSTYLVSAILDFNELTYLVNCCVSMPLLLAVHWWCPGRWTLIGYSFLLISDIMPPIT